MHLTIDIISQRIKENVGKETGGVDFQQAAENSELEKLTFTCRLYNNHAILDKSIKQRSGSVMIEFGHDNTQIQSSLK